MGGALTQTRQTTSAAYPPDVPRPPLTASVHTALTAADIKQISAGKQLYMRPIRRTEIDEIKKLHEEWFPLRYDNSWYEMILEGCVYNLAVVYRRVVFPPGPLAAPTGLSFSRPPLNAEFSANSSTSSSTSDVTTTVLSSSMLLSSCSSFAPGVLPAADEFILAFATASDLSHVHVRAADCHLLGLDRAAWMLEQMGPPLSMAAFMRGYKQHLADMTRTEGRAFAEAWFNPSLAAEHPAASSEALGVIQVGDTTVYRHPNLVCICTLGVVEEFRGLGLGRALLEELLARVKPLSPKLKTVYLTVIDCNHSAIKFYEKLGFHAVTRIESMFFINQVPYGGLIYRKDLSSEEDSPEQQQH